MFIDLQCFAISKILNRDEEYDRGKIKKLRRFKHSFGGPNPFQELAMKKSQSKRLNMVDRSRRLPQGNRSFRI